MRSSSLRFTSAIPPGADPCSRHPTEPSPPFARPSGAKAAYVRRPMLNASLERLTEWRLAPIVLATQARVALDDEVSVRLDANSWVVLIGERPGLSAANSPGAYLTWQPTIGHRDADRNCV